MQQNDRETGAVDVRVKIRQLRELRYSLESEEFGDLSDSLTQSEDFRSLCLEIAEEAVEREAQAEAIESRIKDLQSRKLRITQSAETLRDVILQCMDTRGEKTIASPTLTLGVSNRSPDIVIANESAVPSRFFIAQTPKLDKKALKEAVVTDGEIIDGVALGNGKISLTIRRR